MPPIKDWPHAPIHRINSDGIYMVTGATLYKEHLFPSEEKLNLVEREQLTLAKKHGWQLERGRFSSTTIILLRGLMTRRDH